MARKGHKYFIIRRIYNLNGLNDGLIFEVINENFNTISFHKREKLAKNKINRLFSKI